MSLFNLNLVVTIKYSNLICAVRSCDMHNLGPVIKLTAVKLINCCFMLKDFHWGTAGIIF